MGQNRTPFTETEALLAVMENDDDRALALLKDSTPRELRIFEEQLDRLSAMVNDLRPMDTRPWAERV